jgi:FkbM family methyltransferase
MPFPPAKQLALRFLPEPVLQLVRKHHYARKLAAAEPEPDMALLHYLVPRGGCALDVGANFGLYSRFLAAAVGPTGRVHAIEPVPTTFDVLRSNVRRLGLTQVLVHNVAASDSTRRITMVVPRYPTGGENYYEARIVGPNVAPDLRTVSVKAWTLDELFARHDRIDFVKCDVEGHELNVVRGASAVIRTYRPAWLIELSGNPDDPASAAAELGGLLRRAGYEAYRFDGSRLCRRASGDRCINTFFLRREHVESIPISLRG